MPKDVIVRFTIPFGSSLGVGPTLVFTHWLPRSAPEAISFARSDLSFSVWFDETCLLLTVPDEELDQWVNIDVNRVMVDVVISGISDDLATFIYDLGAQPRRDYTVKPSDPDLQRLDDEYTSLGKRVIVETVAVVNRLILYARNHKGQYWLEPLSVDVDRLLPSENNRFRSMVTIENKPWVRWWPTGQVLVVAKNVGTFRFISSDDWVDVRRFVTGGSRPELVLELLANAESLLNAGYRRSAVIEGVSALEVAISRFAAAPKVAALDQRVLERIPAGSLKAQVEHMGLSGSVRYLLPLLISDGDLPNDVLNRPGFCRDSGFCVSRTEKLARSCCTARPPPIARLAGPGASRMDEDRSCRVARWHLHS